MDLRSSGLGSDHSDQAIEATKMLITRRHNATNSPRIMFCHSRWAAACIALDGGTICTAKPSPLDYVSVRQFARSNGEQCTVPGCAERQTRDRGIVGSA